MSGFTTCLWFDSEEDTKAAVDLYTSIFPNSKAGDVLHYTGEEPGSQAPGAVLTIEFELDGQKFVALNGGPQGFKFDESISFEYRVDTQEEIDTYWEQLTADGGEPGPCGWLKDKFGVSWQIVPNVLYELISSPDQQKGQAAMKAMLAMGKLDIAALQEAYDAA